MERRIMPLGAIGANCVVLWQDPAAAWIVDPGAEAESINAFLEEKGLAPALVLLTHGHFDHVGALDGLLARHPNLPVHIGPGDVPMIGHPQNAWPPDYEAVKKPASLVADLVDGATLAAGGLTAQVIATPGHTPGGACFLFAEQKLLLTGDTLFAGSCGRTDWMRQWRAGDVLKLLAVVLPALLFVGAGLGWIVQEYHRKADRRVAESATTAALSFYRKINENEQGRYLSDPRKLNGEYRQQWKRDLQQLQDRLSAFVRDGLSPHFPSATAAFLWKKGQIQWSTNLVGDCACLAKTNWTPYASSYQNKPLGEDLTVGWQHMRELGLNSDNQIIWARNKRLGYVCGLVVGPPKDGPLPMWAGYVAAGGMLVGMGLLFLAGAVSLVTS